MIINKKGFSLVELLIVILFIAVLGTIAIFAVSQLFNRGREVVSENREEIILQLVEGCITDPECEVISGPNPLRNLVEAGLLRADDCHEGEIVDIDASTFTVKEHPRVQGELIADSIYIETTGQACEINLTGSN